MPILTHGDCRVYLQGCSRTFLLLKTTKVHGHSRLNRGQAVSSNIYSKVSESTVKRRKIYVQYPKVDSKPSCLIHVPVHSSDEFKVLGDFGSKHAKSRPTKDCGNDPVKIKKFNNQQENNAIVNSSVN